MRTAPLVILLLAPALAHAAPPPAPGPGSAETRASRPSQGGEVEILTEGPMGLRLRWRAARGDGRRVLRLAIPPGSRAVLAPADAADGTAGGGVSATRSVALHGVARRIPFADVVLDADALPPGAPRDREIEIRFVAGAPDGRLPPAVLEAPSPLPLPAQASIDESTRSPATAPTAPAIERRADRLEGSRGEAAALEAEALRLFGFANAASAPGFLAEALADPSSRPQRLRSAASGDLRRALGAGRVASTARSGLDGGRLRSSAVAGFETGRVKIVVGPEDGSGRGGKGIYRITGAELAALGVDLSTVPTSDLRLVTHGFAPTSADPQEVALRVEDGGDGRLDAGDHFEFWGEPVLGENVATGWQGLDYTDVNAYVLDALPGARLRMTTRDAAPVSPASPDYLETVRAERNDIFVGNHRTGQYNVDHYYWCGAPALEWQTGDPPVERVEALVAEGLNSASSREASLRVRLLARSGGTHLSEVELGGSVVSSRSGAGSYVEDHVATGLAASTLSPAGNDIRIRVPGGTSSPDRFELDWIELDYPRLFSARSGRLDFWHDAGASARVSGLGAAPPTVLDVSDPLQPVLLTGAQAAGADWVFELGAPSSTPAHHAIAGAMAPRPTEVTWIEDKGLSDPALAVDVVLMGPRAWLDPPLPGVARWVADREGQGLSVLIAPTEDVIDEFNDGVFSPVALGWMLVDAFATWARPPRHALLLGDATLDWKNDLNGRALQTSGAQVCQDMADPCVVNELAWCQHVPTRIFDAPGDTTFLSYFSSDVILAMVAGGDWVPDVALGRIPARTGAEAEALLDKVLAYEQLRAAPPPWAARVATCADQMAAGEEAMEGAQDAAYAAHAAPTWPRTTYHYQSDYIDQGRGTRAEFRGDLILRDWPSVTDGFSVVSYVGHGNSFRWSNAALLTNRNGLPPGCENDAALLEASHVPGGPQPFMVNANCITGSFIAQLGPGLLEELVRQPNGGLIAGIGPTGLTDLAHADPIVDSFYGAIHGPDGRGWRAGDVLLAVQAELSLGALFDATELLNTVLLGDPTLQLVVPVGPASGALRAVAGDERVDLDWDAAVGAGPGTLYSVWRATNASGPWTRIATGLTGLAHADIAAPPVTPDPQNGRRYWYAVEPVDAAGWPGRWSNHADARPCGPQVPAPPSNLVASASACTSSTTITWTASATPFLQGYRVRLYRGPSSSGIVERSTQSAGTFAAFSGLIPFASYTVSVSALSWCNVESPPVERSLQLTCPAVLGPPEWIRDLRVRRSGSDLLFDWSPVTATMRGDPLVPALYRVYRADRPDFFADASRELPAVPSPGTTDAGRVFAGASLEFYAVAAESAAGERGAVGHHFPQGVRQVLRTDAGADWEISWSPVTHDMAGAFTPIASYLVYVRPRAFTDRADISGLIPRRVAASPILVPKVEGDFHLVVPEDLHGNQSVY